MREKLSLAYDHKVEEARVYDALYAKRKLNAQPGLRSALLAQSEDLFRNRVSQLCRGKRILEIGFGDGQPSIWAAQAGAQVKAIDISAEAVSFAAERAKEAGVLESIEFSVGDVEHMPFEDGEFDVVIDNEVFSSLDLEKAIPEISRVLKPAGLLLGKETFGHNPLYNLKRRVNVFLGRRTGWAASHVMRESDFRLLSRWFSVESRQHLHLFVLFAAPLHFMRLSRLCERAVTVLDRLDHAVLRAPRFRSMSFKVVFELRRRQGKA